uniref:Uncharacterized protein n=1 Tax=Oryza barthii TaxID=65489 RepID=A0A0D3HP86_9ORYZ
MSLKSFECAVLPVKKLLLTSCIECGSDDQFFPEEAQEGEEFYGASRSICSQALPVLFCISICVRSKSWTVAGGFGIPYSNRVSPHKSCSNISWMFINLLLLRSKSNLFTVRKSLRVIYLLNEGT